VVTRRSVFELRKARERGHILEGLAVALSNVDEIIALIKAAPLLLSQARIDVAHVRSQLVENMLARDEGFRFAPRGPGRDYGLQSTLPVSRRSATHPEMQLQRLTGLEQEKIVNEYREVMENIATCSTSLPSRSASTRIIAEELAETAASSR